MYLEPWILVVAAVTFILSLLLVGIFVFSNGFDEGFKIGQAMEQAHHRNMRYLIKRVK